MAQCRDRDLSLRSGSKRVQDCQNRGSETIHWFVTLVELKHQKWTQEAAIATHIMASAISRECMISLINNQWADAHLKNILCVVHLVTKADISCNW
jgi:hypothetical protein